ncbi:CHAT domain-containing protein [Streptomyces sp. M41]|uniref:CHAT domain-containing protein n=1 Tax=Streptomyces sp. M41 TaxID=3059412 RepID=UPI00374CD760
MTGEAEGPLDRLKDRTDRYRQQGDPRTVLDPQALEEADAVLRAYRTDDGGPGTSVALDPYAAYVLGLFHWCRHLALPERDQGPDLRQALALFAPFAEAAPEVVPPEALDLLGASAETPDTLLNEVRRRVDLYRNHGDPSGLVDDRGPSLVRRLVMTVADTDGIPYPVAHAMALFHWYRHLAVHDEEDHAADLDEAVRLFRWIETVDADQLPDELWPLTAAEPVVARRAHRAMAALSWACDLPSVDEAITLLARAADALPPDHVSRGVLMAKQGVAHQRRFVHTGDLSDLTGAVEAGRRALDALPADHRDRPRYLSNAAGAHLNRWQMEPDPDPADLEAAVALGEEAVRCLPPAYVFRGAVTANLAGALMARFERAEHPEPADLERAIALGREGLTDPGYSAERHSVLHNLARMLRVRFERQGERGDLEESLRYADEAVARCAQRDPGQLAEFLAESAWIRYLTYEAGQDLADLDAALDALREASAGTRRSHPRYPDRVVKLWVLTSERYRRTKTEEDMAAAIEAGRGAVSLAEGSGTGRADLSGATLRRSLALLLSIRFDRTSDLDALNEAITLLRAAVAEEPEAEFLMNLSTDLRSRARVEGAPGDWKEAVELGRAALEAAPDGHPEHHEVLSQLCATLRERYEALGAPADLEEAVGLGRAAVAATDPSQPAPGPYGRALSHLAGALVQRFMSSGDRADLDDAVAQARLAVERSDQDRDEYAAAMMILAGAVGTRYERRGAAADLDETIEFAQRSADLTEPGSPWRGGRLNNLSIALRARHRRTFDDEDLERAIATAREAVDATPVGHSQRGGYLNSLAYALHQRHLHDGRRADADQAVESSLAAVEATGPKDPRRASYLNNLGVHLVARADEAAGEAADDTAAQDLSRAVGHYEQGLELAADDSQDRFHLLVNLGNAHRRRYEWTGRRAEALEAIDSWRQVAGHPAAPAWPRLASARQWGQIAAGLGDQHESALSGYATAVAQLPLLAWHGLGRGDREQLLTQARGLAADAAAAAIAADRPDLALELLEQGRGVIWSQILDVRSDLAELHATAPDLARELDTVRLELDRPAESLLGESVPVPADHRMRLAERWDTLVEQVRSLPDFETFLKPLSASALCAALGDGPVVVVNVSGLRCDALLVAAGSVRSVPLTGLSGAEAGERANAYLAALIAFAGGRRGLAEQVGLEQAVDELLRWLWDTVAAPVLDALDAHGPLGGTPEALPRVWWYPTGPLTLLPLHAAGHHQENAGRTVLDRVVSSYAPTLKVLSGSRTRPEPQTGPAPRTGPGTPDDAARLLLVTLAATPGLPNLPNVQAESTALTALLPGRCTELTGPRATCRAVGDALPEHAWVHFSCHGGQNLRDPSQGGVHLHDGMLTVEELTSVRHGRGELAFLSACQTALGGLDNLDEAITLTSALQHAGWRHVVGTLWSVGDAAAAMISTATYRQLVRDGRVDADDIARVLHRVTLAMRDELPQRPSVWAPFVHVGP